MARGSSRHLLHPMSVIEICRTVFVVYVRKLPNLFLWALLFFTLPVSLGIYLDRLPTTTSFRVIILQAGLWAFAAVCFYAVAAIVMSLAVENWHASMWQILRRLAGWISIQLLLTVVVYWLIIAVYIVTFVGWYLLTAPLFNDRLVLLLFGFLEVVTTLIFSWIMVMFCLAPAVVVLEGLSCLKAFGRSLRLIRGHRIRAFSAIFLFLILGALAISVTLTAGSVLTGIVVCAMVLFGGTLLCLPIFLYFDVRCRKEAFHLETLREY
jgi:hypothetical protein